jgi:hypothetical protein
MLKAYAVQEEDEGTGGIFYAEHDIVARKAGANEFGDGDLHGITCRRAPWADEYAPGPCPLLVMIDHGWWMECHGCGIRIDSDMEYIPDEADAPVLELKPVEDDRGLFCTVECRERHLVERMERKIYEQWMVDLLRLRLRDKLPGCVETADKPHVYVEKKAGLWSPSPVRYQLHVPRLCHRARPAADGGRQAGRVGDCLPWRP